MGLAMSKYGFKLSRWAASIDPSTIDEGHFLFLMERVSIQLAESQSLSAK